jgi:general secretion pathway protein I
MIASNRCRGYTLIEVLVAMFILALSLTVIFRIFSGGLLKIGIATDYSRAVMVAESVLAATGNTERLIAGETTGRLLDKYLWSRSIEPYETDETFPGDNTPVAAFKVSVIVQWSAGDDFRSLDLNTLILADNFPAMERK